MRERSAGLWAAVIPLLAERCQCRIDEIRIERSPNGKPSFSGLKGSFSLSHDDEMALFAVANVRRLGVDLMAQRGMHQPARLARRVFGSAELTRWQRFDFHEQRRALRERFCVIEAVVKALDWRLWPALGGVHLIDGGAIARVPLRRATLRVHTGEIGSYHYAVVAEQPLSLRWMNS